jgi:hypothetical protein
MLFRGHRDMVERGRVGERRVIVEGYDCIVLMD